MLLGFITIISPYERQFVYLCKIITNTEMERLVEIPKTQIVMAFVATCIEATARMLNTSYKEVYQRMKRVRLIEDYIVPHYETLHTESRENIAQGMAECLDRWEGGR